MIKTLFNQYRYFNYPALLIVLIASLCLCFLSTGDLVLYFNESRSEIGKSVMTIITQFGEEPMYALFFIVFLFLSFRYAIMVPIVGIVVTIFSYGLKSFFKHPRPKVFYQELIQKGELTLIEDIHTIGGLTSFPSGHTMSAFCLFGFVAFVSSNYVKKGFWQFLFLMLAVLVAFSRVYLFQHFLKDVTLGAFLGIALAILLAWFCDNFFSNPDSWYQNSLMHVISRKGKPKV